MDLMQVAAPSSTLDILRGCFHLLRVRQWTKNGFVFAPLLFAGRVHRADSVQTAAWAFASFCLLASGFYIVNDWLDRKQDRLHPEKCTRPIALGLVPAAIAWPFAIALVAAAFSIAWWKTNETVIELEAAYAVISIAYSLTLKHLVLLDVFAVASGFVIRVWVGAYAIGVPASHWVVLCTLLLALFLGFSKRKSELVLLEADSAKHRAVLVHYSAELITQLNLIVCSATVVCYAIYTVAPETVERLHTDHLVYSVPFVIYGLFRYLFLVHAGAGGNPSDVLLRDKPLIVCIILWIICCLWVIYQ